MSDERHPVDNQPVTDVPPGPSRAKWGELFDVFRDVLFGCRIYLSDAEEKVVLFVLQRTRMYGKEWERIPLRHFTEGVWSQRGGAICSRLALKTSTVIDSNRHLKAKGILHVREHPTRAFSYRLATPNELNHHAILVYIRENQPAQYAALLYELRLNAKRLPEPFKLLLEKADGTSAVLKTAVSPVRSKLPSGQDTGLPVRARPRQTVPNSSKTVTEDRTNVAPKGATRSDSLAADDVCESPVAIDPVLEVSEWQERRRDNRRNVNLYARWSEAWRVAMKKHRQLDVGDIPPATFRKLRIALERNSLPSQGVPEFLDWVVGQWPNLRRYVFSSNPHRLWGPATPDLGFVVAVLVPLQAAYKKQHWINPPKWGPPEQPRRAVRAEYKRWAADDGGEPETE